MDIRMPEMSGMELNRELRKKIGTDRVMIYACTAQVLPEEQEQILAQGFDGLLLKPFKEADLLNLLNIPATQSPRTPRSTALHQFADTEKETSDIIALYTRDTTDDIATLRENYHQQQAAGVELLLHRLAGRTAQIGADKIAFQLRKMEIDVRSGDLPTETMLENIISQLTDLILQLQIQGAPNAVEAS